MRTWFVVLMVLIPVLILTAVLVPFWLLPLLRADNSDFATDRDTLPKKKMVIDFDGKRAMGYLKQICAIGPRMSGTKGMRQQQELIKKHFEKLGAKVEFQKFIGRQRSRANPCDMANMIISWHPDSKKRVILCCHYDTRPIADQEPNPRDWHKPFVSANDGGSGVAFLMELGNQMQKLKTKVGVDFVIFDGEEYIFDRSQDRYFLGSKHFASEWKKSRDRVDYRGAILLDMIAGKNAKFPPEGYSYRYSYDLTEDIWVLAGQLGCDRFRRRVRHYVEDDHRALQAVGIPAIDIIDFDYPHWHRLTDTPENCSAEPMEQVAKVLWVWLQQVE